MSLSRADVAKLLAMVAVIDDVDTDDPDTITAWHAMAEEGRWESFEAARRALIVYRTEHPDYPLRPGHITQVLQRVRAAASRSFDLGRERVPDDAADDLDAYKAWVARRAAENQRAAIAAFAAGNTQHAIEGRR